MLIEKWPKCKRLEIEVSRFCPPPPLGGNSVIGHWLVPKEIDAEFWRITVPEILSSVGCWNFLFFCLLIIARVCGFIIHELRLGNNYSKRLMLLYEEGKEEWTPSFSLYGGIILRVLDRLVGRGIRLGGMVWDRWGQWSSLFCILFEAQIL